MKELIPILKTFEEHVHIFHLKHDNLSNTMIVHFWWLLWEVHNKLNIGVLSVVLPNQLKTTTTIIITVIIYIYLKKKSGSGNIAKSDRPVLGPLDYLRISSSTSSSPITREMSQIGILCWPSGPNMEIRWGPQENILFQFTVFEKYLNF